MMARRWVRRAMSDSIVSSADQAQGHSTNFETLSHYLSLIRFSHTIFALPFALLATAWAFVVPLPDSLSAPSDSPVFLSFRWQSLVGILLCMVSARSFAMAVNRYLDRKWDAENPRTANRHLPAGILQPLGVVRFSAACAICFVVSCCLFLPNMLPLVLSAPVLAFLGGYSLAKRFTFLAHFWLGTALMLAPICAWIALRGEFVLQTPGDLLPSLVLGVVVMLWVSGFDIIYACQDADFDQRAGLFSVPAMFGIKNALWLACLCHAAMWAIAMWMSFAFPWLSLGWIFRGMLLVVGILLMVEHSVVSEKSLARVQLAFFQLNSIISILFLVFGTLDAWWQT
jgi:4-hydroxybenzoate polyprenyltransferase